MAENDDDAQEKTEDPSQKRIDDARKRGQVPRSKELNTFAIVVFGVILLIAFGQYMGEYFFKIIRICFTLTPTELLQDDLIMTKVKDVFYLASYLLLPFLSLILLVALIAPILMGGLNFSSESLTPKIDRMDPIKGLKRMFSIKSIIELIKAIFKFLLVMAMAIFLMWFFSEKFLHLAYEGDKAALLHSLTLIGWCALGLGMTLLVVVMIDVPFQFWDYKKQLKMSHKEIKDERKETEGQPEVKQKIRRLQMEMSQKRMMEGVKTADVVITNPTHFAVALSYEENAAGAPLLVAKGGDFIAEQIRKVAEHSDVSIVTLPALARSIYYTTDIGNEIPEGLYLAVAQVLAYVFQLERYKKGTATRPKIPKTVPIPDELMH
ncbi:Flagellar biosynthetic protein FlhB [Piscirickettsia salmonis]|uniref:Flagellar biosynthetic protein FlhB n=1 Tax=Piscirickettsia salmonis TaxID=1238 RepID=A0A1L6TBJ1_PISSA|nr:flagellar biosynthesis protein FlhB [Piscirickettsia salmonis]AKP73879.1 flagellar biosynthetic protein FlhB [Piscirickettsia salmonis LF-89 = ATCC VR-1361]ALB22689.1 flagellar biosynthetic protein FlhB [Piscirickettsia salmonis]ALY02697.1 flagellar biosynthetic protein FlhB [Piscirickettsia salmonis]AMA42242.1 flagellar biosynthetic protein FlhB [Piscirickettsia salmonis]AOS34717.1 flagellar biosynthetic protein FlhB [Piscirickettsia salmonis]